MFYGKYLNYLPNLIYVENVNLCRKILITKEIKGNNRIYLEFFLKIISSIKKYIHVFLIANFLLSKTYFFSHEFI